MSVHCDNYSAAIWKKREYFYGSLHGLKEVCEYGISLRMFLSINRDVTASQLHLALLFMTLHALLLPFKVPIYWIFFQVNRYLAYVCRKAFRSTSLAVSQGTL
jgi:hypothetical protein